jgi:membrane fusion protein (multidrug efflux system)
MRGRADERNWNRLSDMDWTRLAIAGLVVVLAGCGLEKEPVAKLDAEAKPVASKAVLVEVGVVERGRIEAVLERSSPLEAEVQVSVLARTQNPAVELLVEEGDRVEKGEVLLRLESDRQQTDYDQALSQLEKAQIDFDATEKLYRESLVSDAEYRNIRHTFNQAKSQAENAQRQLDYTDVRAPVAGTVTRRSVKVGDTVTTGTPIFEIVDLDSIVAVIHVPEQYLPKLKEEMEARLFSATLGEESFAGYVKRISPVVEAQAGTVKVTVGVRDLGRLRPGMWVDVELVLDSKEDALLIPKRSIVYDNDQTFAYKLFTDTNGVEISRRQLVVAENVDKLHIEPRGGFEAGDRIVVAGQSGLKDESPVREVGEEELEVLAASSGDTNKVEKAVGSLN